MSRHILFLLFAFALFVTTSALSAFPNDGQPETLEQALLRHHIVLTKEAIIGGLQDQDAEVRRLAAQKLAQDGVKDAIPSIVDALRAEAVPLNQASLAFSLAQLGSETGLSMLRTMCTTRSQGYAGMVAAQYMQWLHHDDCREAVIEALQPGGDADSRIQALSLVPSLEHLSKQDSQRAFRLTAGALDDQSPSVRVTASSILGRLGNVSAIPYLERALGKEQNEGCALQMQMDLERLQKAQHSQ